MKTVDFFTPVLAIKPSSSDCHLQCLVEFQSRTVALSTPIFQPEPSPSPNHTLASATSTILPFLWHPTFQFRNPPHKKSSSTSRPHHLPLLLKIPHLSHPPSPTIHILRGRAICEGFRVMVL
ncbi:hypothetical protein M758_12G163000 [Ceratodon purpureus]|nr:hypothetical protein M758_12G163000 [Ceratodon purpureus]